VAELTTRTSKLRWRGLRLLAADQTALNLPETKRLYKRFGAHKGKKGLGAITVEFACLFHVLSRAPFRYAFGPCNTSDHQLLRDLLSGVRKGDLLLLDNGFYSLAAFLLIRHRLAHFLIPMKTSGRPRALSGLGPSDYLCRIESEGKTMTVRVIFVYRDGFRRRRLVTSLLDPDQYPAAELAEIYHKRWDIETFYRDLKRSMKAIHWHCASPQTFEQELTVHMIAVCLIRLAMLEASDSSSCGVAIFSFTRSLTETRVFFAWIGRPDAQPFERLYAGYVAFCARHKVRIKPGRHFSRDQQEYRHRARGLKIKRRACHTPAEPPDERLRPELEIGTLRP
jgi:hypothetical protein